MPIKGIVLIFLIAIVVALLLKDEIYNYIKKKSTEKKDEDNEK